MKTQRHSAILSIIGQENIETQEELIERLHSEGFNVTQATVSRDIRELKLTKVMGNEGKYRYIVPGGKDSAGHFVYSTALTASIVSVDCAGNLVVIKTFPGMANAIAAGIDSMEQPGILGSVAGDDTIFLAVRSNELAEKAAFNIRKNISK